MRRVLALAAVTTAVLAATACTGDPAQPVASPASPSTSASTTRAATPPPTPGDAAVTRQVCLDAAAGAADVTKVFTDQIAALEAAAAKGDQAAMVAAAELIQKKFLALSATLTTLSQKRVDPGVKAALTDAAAALKEISSSSYPGTTQDTQKRLGDLAATFAKVCA
ncbi:MAG: hypothetical protein QOE61_1688 [Micromonosporaceae bacterium]|nr:hypothetical protein [Micromonosporaceae bacterium]